MGALDFPRADVVLLLIRDFSWAILKPPRLLKVISCKNKVSSLKILYRKLTSYSWLINVTLKKGYNSSFIDSRRNVPWDILLLTQMSLTLIILHRTLKSNRANFTASSPKKKNKFLRTPTLKNNILPHLINMEITKRKNSSRLSIKFSHPNAFVAWCSCSLWRYVLIIGVISHYER